MQLELAAEQHAAPETQLNAALADEKPAAMLSLPALMLEDLLSIYHVLYNVTWQEMGPCETGKRK